MLAGNSLAAVYVLDLMLEAWPATDVLVVAPPDALKHDWQPSLGAAARERGVETIEPERVNSPEVVEVLAARGSDLLLSVYYNQIFHPGLLAAVAGPALNFHPSLLPRHRGTAPLVWAVVEGDTTTGVTVHALTEGVDEGPVVLQSPLPIHPEDTGYTLHLKAARLVGAMAARLLRGLLAGAGLPPARDQRGEATHHGRRDPAVNHLDWTQTRERVRNVVRALASPLPGAYSLADGARVVFERVEPADGEGPPRTPGMVEVRPSDGRVLVWAGDGPLHVAGCRVEPGPSTAPTAGAITSYDGLVLR